MGNVFNVNRFLQWCIVWPTKERITYIRLAKDHKLRLTWFRKLRLVDPPNSDNVRVCSTYVVNTSRIFVSLLICQLLRDQEDKKRPDERCCANSIVFQ